MNDILSSINGYVEWYSRESKSLPEVAKSLVDRLTGIDKGGSVSPIGSKGLT